MHIYLVIQWGTRAWENGLYGELGDLFKAPSGTKWRLKLPTYAAGFPVQYSKFEQNENSDALHGFQGL